ncbi:unnamed protein product [Prunus armeniaca]
MGSVPTHSRGKWLITEQPVSLATVLYNGQSASASQYSEFLMRDNQAPEHHASYQPETSTSGCGDAAAESSPRPVVTIVHRGNPRIPLGQSKEYLFGVNYLEPNKITK